MNEDIPLEIGQVWETKLGTVEIVALGPKYVAYAYQHPLSAGAGARRMGEFKAFRVKLIPPPKPKHEMWVNVYRSCFSLNCGLFYSTKAAADANVSRVRSRIACIKIEFQEGDGLT